jgi:hypothetical protein
MNGHKQNDYDYFVNLDIENYIEYYDRYNYPVYHKQDKFVDYYVHDIDSKKLVSQIKLINETEWINIISIHLLGIATICLTIYVIS